MQKLFLLLIIIFITGCSTKPEGKYIVSEHNNKRYFMPYSCIYADHDEKDFDKVICTDENNNLLTELQPVSKEEYQRHLTQEKNIKILNEVINGLGAAADGYTKGVNSVPVQSYKIPTVSGGWYGSDREYIPKKAKEQKKYESYSGKKYQYDLSKPMDQIRYSTDTQAQMRDMRESGSSKQTDYLDETFGQQGGGVYE